MSEQSSESQGLNPAWQPFLDKLPEELHSIVIPELQSWDKTMQDKVQGLQEQYAPYKPLVENDIDYDVIQQSLLIANHLQTDPEDFIRKAMDNFGINFDDNGEEEEEEDMTYDGEDISNHPMFKAMQEKLEEVTGVIQTQTEAEQKRQQETELDNLFTAKQEEKGEFDRLYVASLMASNIPVDQAIDMYHETINTAVAAKMGSQQPQQTTPPVVMGGSGTAGSGTGAEPIEMGKLSNGEVTDLAIQFMQKAQNNQ